MLFRSSSAMFKKLQALSCTSCRVSAVLSQAAAGEFDLPPTMTTAISGTGCVCAANCLREFELVFWGKEGSSMLALVIHCKSVGLMSPVTGYVVTIKVLCSRPH